MDLQRRAGNRAVAGRLAPKPTPVTSVDVTAEDFGYVTDPSGQIWDVGEDGTVRVWSPELQQWQLLGTPDAAVRVGPRTVTEADRRRKERASAQRAVDPAQEKSAITALTGTGSLYDAIVLLEHTPRGSGKLAGEFGAIRYPRQAAVDRGLAAAHLQSIDQFDDAVRALRVVVARRARVIALDTLAISEQILREALGRYANLAECNKLATLLRPFRQGRPIPPEQFLQILDAHRILLSPVALRGAVVVEVPDLLRDLLLQNAEAQLGNVAKTRERLADDPELVLEFDEVVGQALVQMGAGADSVHARLIREGRATPGKSWKRELLDAVLLVLSFATGPFGWIARAAQLGLALHDSAANAAHLDDLRAAANAGVPLATPPPQGSGGFLEALGILGAFAGVLHVPAGKVPPIEAEVGTALDRAPPVALGPRRAVLKGGTEVFDRPPSAAGTAAATPRAARPPIDLVPDPATGRWAPASPAPKQLASGPAAPKQLPPVRPEPVTTPPATVYTDELGLQPVRPPREVQRGPVGGRRAPEATATPTSRPEPVSPRLPGVGLTAHRLRGMAIIDALPAADRDLIYRRLAAMPPEEAGKQLTKFGELEGPERLRDLLEARRTPPAGEGPGPVRSSLDDSEVAALEEDTDLRIVQNRPPPRVSPTQPGVSRGALKNRMIRAGMEPAWARGRPEDWNPHHVLPVSEENHPVLDTLRNHGGWDNNAAVNGYPLPTRPGIEGAEHLPVHQVTGETVAPGAPPRSPQTARDLSGHPKWNDKARDGLDRLRPLMDNPDLLRKKVEQLIDDLKGDIELARAQGIDVLF